MPRYSLDTNICIGFTKGDSAIESHFRKHAISQIAVCSVVRAEMLFGARNSGRPQANLDFYRRFLTAFDSLPFDDRAAEHYGVIRAELHRSGTPIGGNDMMIAAVALANDCVLVTRNHREFNRVTGLRVEVW